MQQQSSLNQESSTHSTVALCTWRITYTMLAEHNPSWYIHKRSVVPISLLTLAEYRNDTTLFPQRVFLSFYKNVEIHNLFLARSHHCHLHLVSLLSGQSLPSVQQLSLYRFGIFTFVPRDISSSSCTCRSSLHNSTCSQLLSSLRSAEGNRFGDSVSSAVSPGSIFPMFQGNSFASLLEVRVMLPGFRFSVGGLSDVAPTPATSLKPPTVKRKNLRPSAVASD